VLQTLVLVAAGFVILGGIGLVLFRSRQIDSSDSVPQNVLTRINAEYRDLR
jgi:LPXTG-motif cell wall-anchored protein